MLDLDALRATDDDASIVEVRDTAPPVVTIATPAPQACFGPGAVPVTVDASATDRCDGVLAQLGDEVHVDDGEGRLHRHLEHHERV